MVPYYFITKHYTGCRYLIKKIIAEFTCEMMVTCGFWNVEIIDNRHFKSEGPYVIVCNHKSIVDTLFTVLLPFDIVYTWKKKWSYVPGFGQLCLLANHIVIDISEESRKNALERTKEELGNDSSVLFYAEGTRNSTPEGLLPFKTGAFRVAKEKDIGIIPITLIGTEKACSSFICDRSNVKIIIDKPIYVQNIDKGIQEVRKIMLNNINKYQKLTGLKDLGRSNKDLLKLLQ